MSHATFDLNQLDVTVEPDGDLGMEEADPLDPKPSMDAHLQVNDDLGESTDDSVGALADYEDYKDKYEREIKIRPPPRIALVPRQLWGWDWAVEFIPRVRVPVGLVIVAYARKDYRAPTAKESPGPRPDTMACCWEMRYIQRGDLMQGYADIRYNFVIGPDNQVYEGRGWLKRPSLPVRYKHLRNNCYFIGYMGDFSEEDPGEGMFRIKDRLLEVGVELNYIKPRFLHMEIPNPWKAKGPEKIPENYLSAIYM